MFASFRCVHRKADEGGISGHIATEEATSMAVRLRRSRIARCVPGRRENVKDVGNTMLGWKQVSGRLDP
jgi:hypothetical protein